MIRGELAALRAQTNMVASRSQSLPRALNKLSIEQSNSTPDRVKRLTKFFGDEPPLMRLFLKKLGYEVSFYFKFNFIIDLMTTNLLNILS